MSLSQKHKAILYSLLLILVPVMFFILRTPLRVRSIVRTYNYWTNPAAGRGGLLKLFIASKYGISRLKGVVARDCKVISEYPNGRILYGKGYDYIDSFKGNWFVYNVDRIILSGPIIEPNDDGYIAKITELMYDKSEITLWDLELSIKKYGRRYLISQVKWTHKVPTDEQMSSFQDMIKVKWYNPDKGFGGRYNEPYMFSTPDFSPDGKKLVFSSLSKDSDIYLVNLDGSGLKRLALTKYWEITPRFTPDGKKIMFMCDKENYAGEPYLVDLDGSNYRRLVPNYFGVSEACFSPDGSYVAFTAQRGVGREVHIMNADGSNIRQLTNSGEQCSSLKFSPDGKKLFFVQRWYDDNYKPPLNDEIFSVNVDGTGLRQLTQARAKNAHNERILDVTDNYVFFLRDTYAYGDAPEVWKMAYNGGMQSKILGVGAHGPHAEAKVLPSDKAIVFVDDWERRHLYRLQIMELDNSGKIRKIANDEVHSKIAVSPDGKYVAYMLLPRVHSQDSETMGLRIVSVDGKESWSIGIK